LNDNPELINIDKDLLIEGENILAIRTVEDWDNRAFIGSENDFWITVAHSKTDLIGSWKFSNTLEAPLDDYILYEHSPGFLYNAMIHPLVGYSIKGAIWYQGESNAHMSQYYHELFSTMITSWRDAWDDEFPFLFVQLAAWLPRHENPTDSDWARLREAQTQTLELPNTAMAVTIDIGDAEDIHPRNKKDVGYRLWQAAKKVVFEEDIVHSGPLYKSHEIVGNTLEITFDFAESGWENKGSDQIEGFAVAGADSVFHWATAKIDKNKIRLFSDQVSNPVHVRYAWADNPLVSLYNKEGLPVVPFRTDDW
jgi:sialate O-acetylesterase